MKQAGFLALSGGVNKSAISYQLSAISYQLSAISYQLSAISYQLSAISYQLSAISYQLEILLILTYVSRRACLKLTADG
ncbi:hypothetical protein HJP15_15050 [Pseudoalteromonas sp. NEC-BIFX-2020_002]|nr:hypothetical protein [Pseudoalteromonas sp. NEC-BIFX-2020_002]